MHNSRAMEIWVGVFVVAGLAALFVLAMRVSNIASFQNQQGYEVVGRFHNIGGLKVKAPVTLAGVPVGRVTGISLDQETLEAKVVLTIRNNVDDIPSDTSASILTSGLLGEQYVGLEPGGMPTPLKDGDELTLTQSAVVLEKLISRFLFDKASGDQ